MSWERILKDAISLVKEKKELAEKIEKAQQSVIEAMVSGNAEKLATAVKDFVSLVGGEEEVAEELADALKEVPVEDERMAKSVWSVMLERSGLLSGANSVSEKEKNIRRQIAQMVLKGIFGAASTEEDEKVAEEQLREALEKAKSMDEVINACRTYVMVKANRKAQEFGISGQFDEDVLKATREEVLRRFRQAYKKELRKEIEARLKAGKDDRITKGLFELWAREYGKTANIEKVYQVLAKTRDWELAEALLKGGK
jgi:polyribonucleotide nucleotidyltransferase